MLDTVERILGMKKWQDWLDVTKEQLNRLGFATLVSKYQLFPLLVKFYPQHPWHESAGLKSSYGISSRANKSLIVLFKTLKQAISELQAKV